MSTKAVQIGFLMAGVINPNTGLPLSGGYVKTLEAGTTNTKVAWRDRDKVVQAPNPFPLDTFGRAMIFAEGIYDFKFYDGDPSNGGLEVDITTSTFNPNGSKFRAFTPSVVSKIANYAATTDDDYLLVDATSGPITIQLPAASGASTPITVKKIDASANAVTVLPQSGETIDGSSSVTLAVQNASATNFSDGNDWYGLSESGTADMLDGFHASASPTIGKIPVLGTGSRVLIDVQVFTSSGTWTKPDGCTAVEVLVIGGGGGGGGAGATSAAQIAIGGGGGGGGGCWKFISSGLGATETVTIGAGGAGGSAGTIGAAGGTSSFGSHCSAAGGGGGLGDTGSSGVYSGSDGGAGGSGSGGDILIPGQKGGRGFSFNPATVVVPPGGNAPFYFANNTIPINSGVFMVGTSPSVYGCGGGGAGLAQSQGGGAAGGDGKGGIVIVRSYS